MRDAQLWLRSLTRRELGEYYKAFIRMDPSDAQSSYVEILLGGEPDDKPYANPYYWSAFIIQ